MNTKIVNIRNAFENTASQVASLVGVIDKDCLHYISMLASLRLVLLRHLKSLRILDGSSVSELWACASELACPLLDTSLEIEGIDPLAVVEHTSVADEIADLGLVFEHTQELELSRKGKSKKFKTVFKRTARRRKGAFFTPGWMAERLVVMALMPILHERTREQIWSLRIVDPACGDGRLLTESLGLILDALDVETADRSVVSRRIVRTCLHGVELDPICAALARTSLWLRCDPSKGLVEGLDDAIVCGDSLLGALDAPPVGRGVGWRTRFPAVFDRPEQGFDAIVANPPFEVLTGFAKRKGLKSYTKQIRKSGYDLALSGNLNTYRLFLERSLCLMASGARMSMVLPFGFMMDRSASKLRAHILRRGWAEQVEVYPESAKSFEGVGQSVVLFCAHRKDASHKALILKNGVNDQESSSISVEQLEILDSKDLVLPIAPAASISLATRMSSVCTSSVGELAEGMVGELDQTKFRSSMMSSQTDTLLVRGVHMSAYRVNLKPDAMQQRWVDWDKFRSERGGGRWCEDIAEPRLVQTGIVNMEASRRLVAALVPVGVVCGNSVNCWVPRENHLIDRDGVRLYLLAILNSTPAEWRFRLSSSNNNINLYEIRSLPLPAMTEIFPADRIESYLDGIMEQICTATVHPLAMVRQITAGWGAPGRTDRVVALLLGRVADLLQKQILIDEKIKWLEHLLDHLVSWHLGLDEPDLEHMLDELTGRAWIPK